MGLIIGLRRRATRLASVFSLCPRCSLPSVQVVLRVRSWVTVLLVPAVPLHTSYLARCAACGGRLRLTPFQALEAIEQAELQHAEHELGEPGAIGPMDAPPARDGEPTGLGDVAPEAPA